MQGVVVVIGWGCTIVGRRPVSPAFVFSICCVSLSHFCVLSSVENFQPKQSPCFYRGCFGSVHFLFMGALEDLGSSVINKCV